MANVYKTTTVRSANAIAAHKSTILVSADGTRKAYGRTVKCPGPNGTWTPVEAWTLKEKVNGKWVTYASQTWKSKADAWVSGMSKAVLNAVKNHD